MSPTRAVARTIGPTLALGLLLGPALAAPEAASDFDFNHWTLRDGLPQSSVTAIRQTADGELWLATFAGLARFDGRRFDTFDLVGPGGLEQNRFVSLAVDADDRLWVGPEDGAPVVWTGGAFGRVEGLADPLHTTWAMAPGPGGEMWIGAGRGLFRWVPQGARRYGRAEGLPSDRIFAVLPLGDDTVLVGTDRGLARVRGSGATAVGEPRFVWSLFADRAGQIWVGAADGLFRLEGDTLELAFGDGQPGLDVRALAQDPGGALWIGSGHGVHVAFAPEQPAGALEVATLAPLPGRPAFTVRALFVDREGSVWIGTDGQGLIQARPTGFARYGTAHGLPGPVSLPITDDGAGGLWIGSGCSRLTHWDGERFAPAPVHIPDLGCVRALLRARDGSLWIGHGPRLGRVADGVYADVPPPGGGLFPDAIKALHEARDTGELWIGTGGSGVLRRRADGTYTRLDHAQGLPSDHVERITEDSNGTVWLGTRGGLVSVRGEAIRAFTAADGLSPGAVREIHFDDRGVMWIGTYGGGLTRFEDGRFVRITREAGLFDNVVSRILADDAGHLWLNGNRGVFRIPRDVLDAFERGERADVAGDFLDTGEGNGGAQPAGWRTAAGELWFPTVDGVVRLRPDRVLRNELAPQARVEQLLVDGAPAAGDGAIDCDRRDVTVRYTAASFVRPEAVRFRHRLVGYDRHWIEAGPRRQAHYTNLPPGDYRFEVVACNSDGVCSDRPAVRAFTLLPYLHETTTFRAAGALGLLLLGLWAHRGRLRRADARNRRLQAEIEERRRIEAALREREARYRQVFESAVNGFVLVAADGRILEINPGACRMHGLRREDALGCPATDLVAAESRAALRALVEQVLAGSPAYLEPAGLRADGCSFAMQLYGAPFEQAGDDGRPRALLVALDVSPQRRAAEETRRLEQQLAQARKLEAIGRLAGGISHDFNNILTAISSNVELAELALGDGDLGELRLSVDELRSATDVAAGLTRSLLAFSRRQTLEPGVVDIDELVGSLRKLLGRLVREEVQLRFAPRGDAGAILADPGQVERTLLNLVITAGDAMPDGGTLTIATHRHLVTGAADGCPPGAYACVEVCAPDAAAAGFGPLATDDGGAGLATVLDCVRLVGGYLAVGRAPDRGPAYRVLLPQVRGAEAPPSTGIEPGTPWPEARATVLVCDDDARICRAIVRGLDRHGYRVLGAHDPAAAVDIARREEGGIDLLVTDVIMPGMNGPELAARVRALYPEIRVLYMSGHTSEVILTPDAPDRAIEFLPKPFTVEALLSRVRALLEPGPPLAME